MRKKKTSRVRKTVAIIHSTIQKNDQPTDRTNQLLWHNKFRSVIETSLQTFDADRKKSLMQIDCVHFGQFSNTIKNITKAIIIADPKLNASFGGLLFYFLSFFRRRLYLSIKIIHEITVISLKKNKQIYRRTCRDFKNYFSICLIQKRPVKGFMKINKDKKKRNKTENR